MKKSIITSARSHSADPGHDDRPFKPLMTVEVVQVGEKFKAALVEVQPLVLGVPPIGEDRLDALAREVVRRARYQLLPFSERESWKDEQREIVARAFEFEGMTQADLMRASPEEMIDRFVEMTRKRRGDREGKLLKQKIDYLLNEIRKSNCN